MLGKLRVIAFLLLGIGLRFATELVLGRLLGGAVGLRPGV